MVSLPSGDRTKDISFAKAKDNVRDQARKYAVDKDRRMRLGIRGKLEPGVWRTELDKTMDQWEKLLRSEQPGDVILLDIEDYPYTIGTRIIDVSPPTKQTEGNSDIDKIFTWLINNKKGRNGGICNRRSIAGTSTWSQHSPWPGPDPGSNAVDWFSSPDTMDELYDQGHDVVRANLPIGLVLVGNQAWEPGRGWHLSSAEYHRHLHIQGQPERGGSPQGSC